MVIVVVPFQDPDLFRTPPIHMAEINGGDPNESSPGEPILRGTGGFFHLTQLKKTKVANVSEGFLGAKISPLDPPKSRVPRGFGVGGTH